MRIERLRFRLPGLSNAVFLLLLLSLISDLGISQTWYESKFNLTLGEPQTNEEGLFLLEAPSGDLYLVGVSNTDGSSETGNLLLAKLDQDGQEIWVKEYQIVSPLNPQGGSVPATVSSATVLTNNDLVVSFRFLLSETIASFHSADGSLAWWNSYESNFNQISVADWEVVKAGKHGSLYAIRSFNNGQNGITGFEIVHINGLGAIIWMHPYNVINSTPMIVRYIPEDLEITPDGGLAILTSVLSNPGGFNDKVDFAVFKVESQGDPTGYAYSYQNALNSNFLPLSLLPIGNASFGVMGHFMEQNPRVFYTLLNGNGDPLYEKIYRSTNGTLEVNAGAHPGGALLVGQHNGSGAIVQAGVTGIMNMYQFPPVIANASLNGISAADNGRYLMTGGEGDDAILFKSGLAPISTCDPTPFPSFDQQVETGIEASNLDLVWFGDQPSFIIPMQLLLLDLGVDKPISVQCFEPGESRPNDPKGDDKTDGRFADVWDMKLHPNPASTSVIIQLPKEAKAERKLTLYSLDGKMIYQKLLPAGKLEHHLSLRTFPVGNYILQVEEIGQRPIGKPLQIIR
ncbi:MAG: T9SS type A sorting domain-containing protein [Bacteroidota bacterium]